MSWDFITPCWQTETGSATLKSVLMSLAGNADEDGFCSTTVRYIMARTELSERSVRGALLSLEQIGFVRITEQFETSGRQTKSLYQLDKAVIVDKIRDEKGLPERHPWTTQRGAGAAPIKGGRGAGSAPTGVQAVHPLREVPRVSASEVLTAAPPGRHRGGMAAADPSSQPADDDEQQVMGAAKKKTATAQRKNEAVERSTGKKPSGFGLAVRMNRQLRSQGFEVPVDEKALASRLNALTRGGFDITELQQMVDVFVASPRRYMHGDVKPWVGFLAAREKLRADAAKSRSAATPASEAFANVYDGLD